MTSYQYMKSHCGDKTILRPSYLHNGISYTGKMTSLYWLGAQVLTCPGYVLLVKIALYVFCSSIMLENKVTTTITNNEITYVITNTIFNLNQTI